MTADLSGLPHDWRMNRVRHVCDVAEGYARHSERISYWLRLRTNLRRRLEKAGHPPEEVARQIDAFRQAVRRERELRELRDGVQVIDRRRQQRAGKGKTGGGKHDVRR